jgi:hypothetical protein
MGVVDLEVVLNLLDRFIVQLAHPLSFRRRSVRKLLKHVKIGSFEARLGVGAFPRPHYAMCLYYAALQAKHLGYRAISAVELGVAGGSGLLCMSELAKTIHKELGVEILVTGFDAGSGLPDSDDPRDVKYYWSAGAFPMNRQALQSRLAGRAELIIGDVADTCPKWSPSADAPLGVIAFDLDMYTSTMATFSLLEKEHVLPRVWCYFDDIIDEPQSCLTDFLGEAAAIEDFNRMPQRKVLGDNLSPARVFGGYPIGESWHRKIYLYHRFTHPQYNISTYDRSNQEQLSLV